MGYYRDNKLVILAQTKGTARSKVDEKELLVRHLAVLRNHKDCVEGAILKFTPDPGFEYYDLNEL